MRESYRFNLRDLSSILRFGVAFKLLTQVADCEVISEKDKNQKKPDNFRENSKFFILGCTAYEHKWSDEDGNGYRKLPAISLKKPIEVFHVPINLS
jgi:hypothetical protein